MARLALFFAAVALAMHVESVPLPDAGDLVVTTTDTLPTGNQHFLFLFYFPEQRSQTKF